jgi:hypothetical protein
MENIEKHRIESILDTYGPKANMYADTINGRGMMPGTYVHVEDCMDNFYGS